VSEGERARLFVALELPAPARRALVGWREDLIASSGLGVRTVPAESLHVTLCFLGWCAVDEMTAIANACGVVTGWPATSLSVGPAKWLPPRRPRVLAVELSDLDGRLARVQAALSDVLSAGGWYVPEQRPFYAHVTVGRVPKGARMRRAELPATDRASFSGDVVTLYRSRLGRGGAVYEPLASVHLGSASSRASNATSGEPRPET
jgi:RNA 2',3'-cyclic 3'-phosphodiesterase